MNPNCIVNKENLDTKFKVVQKKPVKIKCEYCEREWQVRYEMIEEKR